MLLDDEPYPMEKTSKSWIGGSLVVDKLDFDRFHGRDRKNSFADSGAETGEKSSLGIEFPVLVDQLFFDSFEGAETYGRFGNGAV